MLYREESDPFAVWRIRVIDQTPLSLFAFLPRGNSTWSPADPDAFLERVYTYIYIYIFQTDRRQQFSSVQSLELIRLRAGDCVFIRVTL